MNTNSKHYEILAIEPWDIMEANFPPHEFVAYLKGNIIKYTLRSKGQDLSDAEKIKHYAEKLIKVLEKKDMDEFLDEDAERIYGDYGYGQEEPEEAYEPEPISEHKFKVGDRVELIGYDYHFKEGQSKRATIIKIGVPYSTNQYLLKLDEESKGWHATKSEEGIKCDSAWLVYDHEIKLLEPLKEKSTPALIPNLWYDASLYTVEKLKELLPVGTKVVVTSEHDNDRKVNLREEIVREAKVKLVKQRPFTKDTRIGIDNSCLVRRYFKIVKEN